jgi:hypothetical protein
MQAWCLVTVFASLPVVGTVTVDHPLLTRTFHGLPLEAEVTADELALALWGLRCTFRLSAGTSRSLSGTCQVSRDGYTVDAEVVGGALVDAKLTATLRASVSKRAMQELFGEVVSVDVPLGEARVSFDGRLLTSVSAPAPVPRHAPARRPVLVRPAKSRCRLVQ